MAGTLRLFVDERGKQNYKSHLSGDVLSPFPSIFSGQQPIEFTLLRENPSGLPLGDLWERISPSTYSLAIGLYKTSDGSVLAYQNVWVNDPANAKKTGALAIDTAAINLLLATDASFTCTLQATITDADGNNVPVYQAVVTVRKSFFTPGVSPVPGETAATQNWAKATFVRKEESDGQTIVLRSGDWGVEISVDPTTKQVLLDYIDFS